MKVQINIIQLFTLLHVCSSLSFHNEKYIWLPTLSTQIVQELKPHQITFFGNKTYEEYINEELFVSRNLIHDIPCEIVSLEQLLLNEDNLSATSSFMVSKPRHATLNVILNSVDYQSVNATIDLCAQLSPYSMRPHCFYICFNKYGTSVSNIRSILRHAWSKNFLDFSVLTVDWGKDYNASAVIFNYNPFYDQISYTFLNPEVKIFPYKLNNVNGYLMKLSFWNRPPLITAEKNQDGAYKVGDRNYPFTDFAVKVMNFTTEFIYFENSPSKYDMLNKALLNREINMNLVPLSALRQLKGTTVEFMHEPDKLIAIVPILCYVCFKSNR